MKTFIVILVLSCIAGWIVRYRNHLKGKYKFNPMEEHPTLPAILLVLSSILSLCILSLACIKYLP